VFELGAVDLGKLSQVKVRHDGTGPGSGWLLDRVVVKETADTTIRYVFRYERFVFFSYSLNPSNCSFKDNIMICIYIYLIYPFK